MAKFPMLVGVDEERVAKVGGKAAILEEILRKNPRANVPVFEYVEKDDPVFPNDGKTRILRESSELDVFGGFGLSASFANLSTQDHLYEALFNLRHPEEIDETRVRLYAQSVGKDIKQLGSSAMLQVQGIPRFWAVVMQHPSSDNHYLVAYSNSQSIETIVKSGEENIRQMIADTFGIRLRGSDRYWKRQQYWAITTKDKVVDGEILAKPDVDMVMRVVREYIALQELGIVASDWTSIGEFGMLKDGVEIYQFTPVRMKSGSASNVNPNLLVYGVTEPIELPVVKFPRMLALDNYFEDGSGLDRFPDFRKFIELLKKQYDGIGEPPIVPKEFFVHAYVFDVEQRHPNGYLAVAPVDGRQQFDIPMENARAVLLGSGKSPVLALNHNTSRLLYKAPVLIVGDIKDELNHGQNVKFASDGVAYSIRK